MVSPEEIERVDVLYGPFSAAYPGNSIGAVVNITTRMPDGLEAIGAASAASVQHFDQYGDAAAIFPPSSWPARSATAIGPLRLVRLSANHVDSESQPLAYVTAARPANASAAGTPVTGAFADLNRTGAPIVVLGAGGFEHQVQDNLKLKLALDFAPDAAPDLRGGLFLNDTDSRTPRAICATPAAPGLCRARVNIDGRAVTIPASAFSNNVYRLDERHWMHALSLEADRQQRSTGASIGALYDYRPRTMQRIPSVALPGGGGGGAGSIVRLDGTGWRTLDLHGCHARADGARAACRRAWRPASRSSNRRFATADWIAARPGALSQAARGQTRTLALWAQDAGRSRQPLTLTLGGRYEWWRAYDGRQFLGRRRRSTSTSRRGRRRVSRPRRRCAGARRTAGRSPCPAGQAYALPDRQRTLSGDHDRADAHRAQSRSAAGAGACRPSSRSSGSIGGGHVRLSLFNETIKDALISQTAPLVPGSTALFSYVQKSTRVRTPRASSWPSTGASAACRGFESRGSVTLVDPKIVADPAFPAAEGKDMPQVPRRRATLVAT